MEGPSESLRVREYSERMRIGSHGSQIPEGAIIDKSSLKQPMKTDENLFKSGVELLKLQETEK